MWYLLGNNDKTVTCYYYHNDWSTTVSFKQTTELFVDDGEDVVFEKHNYTTKHNNWNDFGLCMVRCEEDERMKYDYAALKSRKLQNL